MELGGTVGDIESMPFIEALRQMNFSVGPSAFCLVHVSLVPVLGTVGEQKTKPTQHSVRELRALGLAPNLLACRSAKVRSAHTCCFVLLFRLIDRTFVYSLFRNSVFRFHSRMAFDSMQRHGLCGQI